MTGACWPISFCAREADPGVQARRGHLHDANKSPAEAGPMLARNWLLLAAARKAETGEGEAE